MHLARDLLSDSLAPDLGWSSHDVSDVSKLLLHVADMEQFSIVS